MTEAWIWFLYENYGEQRALKYVYNELTKIYDAQFYKAAAIFKLLHAS